MTPLTKRQRRWLKPQVHHLRPVVIVGQNGVTEAVLKEIELALDHHELIKVKVNAGERQLRDEMVAQIQQRTDSDLVDRIGNIAALFRANPEKKHRFALPEG